MTATTEPTVQAAYAACLAMARAHYENFPVASWLVPAAVRPHIAAMYAFARIADDLADEGTSTPGEREAHLTDWIARLHDAVAGRHPAIGPHAEVLTALAATIRDRDLPMPLFDDLVSAFVQDTRVTRYETWEAVHDYCRRSANPIGRLVLRIAGVDSARTDQPADALCTGLQLVNFWQDLAVDWQRGRLYVPREVADARGADVSTFDPFNLTHEWRLTIADCLARTRECFVRGRGVTDVVSGRLRHELRLTWLGGMRILDRLESQVLTATAHARPSLGARDAASIAIGWVSWRTPGLR